GPGRAGASPISAPRAAPPPPHGGRTTHGPPRPHAPPERREERRRRAAAAAAAANRQRLVSGSGGALAFGRSDAAARSPGLGCSISKGDQAYYYSDSAMTKHSSEPRLFVVGYPRIPNEGGDWRMHGPWRDLKDTFPDARVFMDPVTCNATVTFACEDDLHDALKQRRSWRYTERDRYYDVHATEKPRAVGLLTLRGKIHRYAIKELKEKLGIPDLPWAHILQLWPAAGRYVGFKEEEILVYFNEGAEPEYAAAKDIRSVEIEGYTFDVRVSHDFESEMMVESRLFPEGFRRTETPAVTALLYPFHLSEQRKPPSGFLSIFVAAFVCCDFPTGLVCNVALPALADFEQYKRQSVAQMRELNARIDTLRVERDEAEAAKCRLERKLKLFEDLYREELLEKQVYRSHVYDVKRALGGLLERLPSSSKDDEIMDDKEPEPYHQQPQEPQQQQPPSPPPQQQQQEGPEPDPAPQNNTAARAV
ncbi:MAG: hypothetical protein BJ554DRAFT_2628, partial [Olpidium bornovanus]